MKTRYYITQRSGHYQCIIRYAFSFWKAFHPDYGWQKINFDHSIKKDLKDLYKEVPLKYLKLNGIPLYEH